MGFLYDILVTKTSKRESIDTETAKDSADETGQSYAFFPYLSKTRVPLANPGSLRRLLPNGALIEANGEPNLAR